MDKLLKRLTSKQFTVQEQGDGLYHLFIEGIPLPIFQVYFFQDNYELIPEGIGSLFFTESDEFPTAKSLDEIIDEIIPPLMEKLFNSFYKKSNTKNIVRDIAYN